MKKIISMVLLATMMLTLVSCFGEPPQLMDFLSADDGVMNFNGMEFRFAKVQDYFMDDDAIMGYVYESTFSDAAKARIAEIEETYGIVYKEILVDRVNDLVLQESVGGNSSVHAVQDESFYLGSGIRAGLYADLTQLTDYLDYTDSHKWGSPNILTSLCWDGGLYAVIPAAMPLLSYSSACSVIAANVDYIKGVGMPDPRTYWENDEWTWETLKEILPLYTQPSDVNYEYKYGLLSGGGWFIRGMIHSNCENFFAKNDSGTYVPIAETAEGRRALDTAYDFLFGELAYTIDQTKGALDFETIFPSGNYAMANVDSYQVYSTSKSLVYTMSNLAILPFPTGPDMEVGTVTSCSSSIDYATAIPATVLEPWVSAVIINALYEPFEGYKTDENMFEYMKEYYFNTEQDAKLFIEITKSPVSTFSSPESDYITYACFNLADQQLTVTKFIESNGPVAKEILEEYVVPAVETVNEIFD